MRRTNLYLTETQRERLHALARAEGLSIAEMVRRAVDAYLAWNDPTYRPDALAPNKEVAFHPPHDSHGITDD